MTVKKKQGRFNGCPHGWVLNIGAPGLRATPLVGDAADAIPSALEPPVAVKDLTQMSTSQVVDFHAFVLRVSDQMSRKDKSFIEVTFSDATKTTMTMTFWEESMALLPPNALGTVLYAFDAFLVQDTAGSLKLTATKASTLFLADGHLPKAKALLERSTTTEFADADVTSST